MLWFRSPGQIGFLHGYSSKNGVPVEEEIKAAGLPNAFSEIWQ